MLTQDGPPTPLSLPASAGDASRLARPRRPLSARALAARHANIAKAHAADKDLTYRMTERCRAASLANIQKAIAWRRTPEGNARARLNALRHGLNAVQFGEAAEKLDQTLGDLRGHRARGRALGIRKSEELAATACGVWRGFASCGGRVLAVVSPGGAR